MKDGDEILSTTETLDNKFFLSLKGGQCKVNPYLTNFMSEIALKASMDTAIQRRLLQIALITLEILGAGDANDKDYVKVSKESIDSAKKSGTIFNTAEVHDENPPLAKTMLEAKFYARYINDIMNKSGTRINTDYIWKKMEILLKAYWFETRKQKSQH